MELREEKWGPRLMAGLIGVCGLLYMAALAYFVIFWVGDYVFHSFIDNGMPPQKGAGAFAVTVWIFGAAFPAGISIVAVFALGMAPLPKILEKIDKKLFA